MVAFRRFGNTRQALKAYDPGLAALLTEIYGDSEWRYTSVETRTNLPHLHGFNPQDSPVFTRMARIRSYCINNSVRNPNSDGGGEWVNLKSCIIQINFRVLLESNVLGRSTTAFAFVNFSPKLMFWLYGVHSRWYGVVYWTRVPPGYIGGVTSTKRINEILI